jgi:hypothetical protein
VSVFTSTDGSPGTGNYTVTPGPAASIAPSGGSGQSATVGSAFTNPLKFKVSDQFGNGVSGENVTVDLPATGATGAFPGPEDSYTAATDAAGEVTTPAITASTLAGEWEATASSGALGPAEASLTNSPDAPDDFAIVSGDDQTTTVNTQSEDPYAVRVRDQYGNGVPNEDVTFALPASGAGGAFGGTQPVQTDSSGEASAGKLNANTIAGDFQIGAMHGTLGTLTFDATNEPGAADHLETAGGQGMSAQVTEEFPDPIAVRVEDEFGNAVPEATVDLALPGSGPSATFAGGGASYSDSSDASGVIEAPLMTANTLAGDWNATASASGVPNLIISETNAAGPAAELAVVSGGGQTAAAGGTFGEPLVALVSDVHGNPVPNAPVSFSAPGAGPSGSFASPGTQTGANGRAGSGTITANDVLGDWTATASSGALSATAGLTNVDRRAPTVEITKAPKGKTTKKRVTIAFRSDEDGSSFECRLDGAGPKSCKSPAKVRVKPGKHTFEVRATDAAGNVGGYAKVKFKVAKKPRKR